MESTQGSLDDYKKGFDAYKDKTFTFRLKQKLVRPILVTSISDKDTSNKGIPQQYPPYQIIPITDIIYDEKVKSRRAIRFVPGETTIFEDEMSDITKDKIANKTIRNSIKQFVGGHATIKGYERYLLEFMMRSNYNDGTKKYVKEDNKSSNHIFELVDNKVNYKLQFERDKSLENAKHWCYNGAPSEILNFARPLLGVSYLTGKSMEEIRMTLLGIASANPEKFLKDKESPILKRKGVILQAIDMDVLKVNQMTLSVAWSDNENHPLSTAAIGIDPIDQFVNVTFTPTGENVYLEIIRRMQPREEAAIKEEKPLLTDAVMSRVEAEVLVEELIEKDVIQKRTSWIFFGDEKYRKGDLIDKLQEDKYFSDKFKEKLIEIA